MSVPAKDIKHFYDTTSVLICTISLCIAKLTRQFMNRRKAKKDSSERDKMKYDFNSSVLSVMKHSDDSAWSYTWHRHNALHSLGQSCCMWTLWTIVTTKTFRSENIVDICTFFIKQGNNSQLVTAAVYEEEDIVEICKLVIKRLI